MTLAISVRTQPQQVPIPAGGATLLNVSVTATSVATIALASTQYFDIPEQIVTLNKGMSLPVQSGPIWIKNKNPGKNVNVWVMDGLFNISNPTTTKVTNVTKITSINKVTDVSITNLPPPVVKTIAILSARIKLLGTTTAVPIVPASATQTYFANCKIGFVIWGTPTNTGKKIYLGDHAGGVGITDASIPAGVTKLIGSFSVAFGNAVTIRISGKTGDYANVWAA